MGVLIVRAGALGDVLLLRPTIAAARRAGHDVRLLAPAGPGAALVGPGEASALVPLDGGEVARALAGAPDPGFSDRVRADFALALTRSADLSSVLRPYVGRLVARDPDPPPGRHAATWAAEGLRELGDLAAPPDGGVAPLVFTGPEIEEAEARREDLPPGFLALHPGSGSAAKNWPVERFAALARALSPDESFLVVAGPADGATVAALRESTGMLVAEGLPVRVLGALLARCGLFVGNDSGVSHLAAAAGAPTLALFGPTDPAAWAPVGPAVRVLLSPDRTMTGLALADVERAATALREQARP